MPAALRELRAMLDDYYPNLPTVLVEPGVRTGVSLQYENPKEVGADRIVNTLAAHHLVGDGPAIVVDFGTTTNFDVVNDARRLPRRRAGARASRSRSTRSPPAPPSCARSSWSTPRGPIGKSTVEALQSGILYGFAGQVDGLVRRLSSGARTRRIPARSR